MHVNILSIIDHDCIIDDYVTINSGSNINGDNQIKMGSFIGSNTVTKQGISIGQWTIIGVGTVLIDDAKEKCVYVGLPGKIKKRDNSSSN